MSVTSTSSTASIFGLLAVLSLAGCAATVDEAAAPIAEVCGPGQVQSEATEGHCCWPGQSWADGACQGAPLCPEGLVVDAAGGCGCEAGRALDASGHCCYEGQAWSDATAACAGAPSACPEGRVVAGETCRPGGWVAIEGGTFTMGTDSGADVEGPAHQVTLSPYSIGRTEVTVREYAACVAAGACAEAPREVQWRGITRDQRARYSGLCNAGREGREDHPVNCVDYELAEAYCTWAGGSLPTEAQWEYAARGDDARVFAWGAEAPTPARLNACDVGCVSLAAELGREWSPLFEGDDGYADTAPVGSYPAGASPFGVLDTAGNVWEWVSDKVGRYERGPATNPTGPTRGRDHITRGGAWDDDSADLVRTTTRDAARPDLRDVNVGFRCARPAQAGE